MEDRVTVPERAREPGCIVVAGDWHGNTNWAVATIATAVKALRDTEGRPLILHLGDFGIWPNGAGYVRAVERALRETGAELWFIDGNHEDFTQIAAYPQAQDGRRRAAEGLWHLPRGHRWVWHGRTWLAVGGAVSVDKAGRTEGVSWWPQEEITPAEEQAVIAGGPADVMVSHDCPAGVRLSFPPPPSWWALRDLARSDAHRDRLQRITDAVKPVHLAHGHLHMAYQRVCDFGYGPVQVTGFDRDEGHGPNWAVLNVETMDWETP